MNKDDRNSIDFEILGDFAIKVALFAYILIGGLSAATYGMLFTLLIAENGLTQGFREITNMILEQPIIISLGLSFPIFFGFTALNKAIDRFGG